MEKKEAEMYSSEDEDTKALEIINNIKKYVKSDIKGNITEINSIFSKLLEKSEVPTEEQKIEVEEEENINTYTNTNTNTPQDPNSERISNNILNILSKEINIYILTFFDPFTLFKVSLVCKELNGYSKGEYIDKIYRNSCFLQWGNPQVFKMSTTYSTQFTNWKNMFFTRDKLRFEGVYICVSKYYKTGESERDLTKPVFLVKTFRYLRFFSDGKVLLYLTNKRPSKVLSIFTPENPKVGIGDYIMLNDHIVINLQATSNCIYEYHLSVSAADYYHKKGELELVSLGVKESMNGLAFELPINGLTNVFNFRYMSNYTREFERRAVGEKAVGKLDFGFKRIGKKDLVNEYEII